ncbi:uncharacterized protein LOC106636793 [Copidosoma floridanum]|uniref:uncharacterized protein LOC106636793 n=1 Tax=Copidosoma floridanum TaxID=29053 RepID=UPI0006C9BC34|nr:uncharacterized protein LOC106636793 [Copidosoma floridanum]
MDLDELVNNVFYLLLQNDYKKKYDHAVSKCWTICVPSGHSLREVSITKEFIDDHVLKPIGRGDSKIRSRFVSTDAAESHVYEIENNTIKLINNDDGDDNNNDEYRVNILSTEKGYNKEFQLYNIIIVDEPIHRKYRIAQICQSHKFNLNRNITSYKEALEFLKELPEDKTCSLDDLVTEVEMIEINRSSSVDKLKQRLHKLYLDYWASTIRKQSLDVQRDARFQKLLSFSLEIFVMHLLHESLYSLLSFTFKEKDLALKNKICQLIKVGVTTDQLGVKKSLAIPLPAAIVELAAFASYRGPLEKLLCLKSTIDFIVAEIKGALADVESKTDLYNDEDKASPSSLDTEDLILLLLFVIIKCRCERLYTDLYYLENFIWCVSPHDEYSYTIVTFKAALTLLNDINPSDLSVCSDKVKSELKTTDFSDTVKMNEVKTPVDRQLQDLATTFEECAQT